MRIAKIKPNDIANGDGVVVSVWTQGCSHHCSGCHNPDTWNFKGGRPFTDEDEEYIINIMNKNGVERDLSLLGGEPLEQCNLDRLQHFLKRFRKCYPNKKIYLWSGFLFEEILNHGQRRDILNHIDILIDGRYDESLRNISLKMRGSENQRVINVQESLKQNKIILIEGV